MEPTSSESALITLELSNLKDTVRLVSLTSKSYLLYVFRYLAEFATGNDRKEAAENSLVAYKAASDIAMTELPPTHPIR